MFYSKYIKSLALLLSLAMLLLVGCKGGNNSASVNTQDTPWAVTKYNANEIIDSKGNYILDKLTPVTVAEMKKTGDKNVIYHLGQPYLMRGMHFRYDHLETARDYEFAYNKITDAQMRNIFDTGMRLIKESGFNTVSIYLSLGDMYDGNKVDFSLLEYQYSVAKKYDLNIVITWFGHMVCGFGGYNSWQTQNSERYPALKDEKGNIMYTTGSTTKMIPDFSAPGFIEDEAYVLQQICAWLNVNDTDRRTIGIQIEDEPNNTEGGHGLWYSQYENVINFIDKMALAIKESSYSMITYTTLMSSGWDDIVDGRDFSQQILGLIEKENLDSVGYGYYTLNQTPHISHIEQSDNHRFMVGFGCCQWNVPAQTNYLLTRGYSMNYYMLHLYYFDNQQNPLSTGLFYFKDKNNPFVYRDGTRVLDGQYAGGSEVVASEFIMMNHSILNLAQLIAVSPNSNMIHFNNLMETDFVETKTLGKTFTFETKCSNDRYGSTALLIKSSSSTYYTYAHKTATITVDGGIKSASEGFYKNGKWVKTKDVQIVDGKMTYEPGKAYQIVV